MARYLFRSVFFALVFVVGRSSPADDAIVVCPADWQSELNPWIQRRSREGITSKIITPQRDAATMLKAVRDAAGQETRFVLLVGDSPVIGDFPNPKRPIPIHYAPTTVTANWNSTKTLATDWFYGDLNQDGRIDAAVGRLPVHNAGELKQSLAKQFDHESSNDFGLWRDRVELIGGVGGFGPLIDTAIESVSRTIVTGVLPNHVQTRVRFGSVGHRFYPTERQFTETVLDDYSRGSRFWVYAGHGQVTELDRVPQTRSGRPVLDRTTVTKLKRRETHRPIAMILACYTGAMDANEDCFAENLWTQPSGPVAVIAGARVTMPYGNTTAAMGMIDAVYRQSSPRLGDAWLSALQQLESPKVGANQATRMMVDGLAGLVSPAGTDLAEERKEHARLYNLIGDPTLRLQHAEPIELQTESGFDQGVPLTVSFQAPIDGELTFSLSRPLGSVVEGDANELTIHTQTSAIAKNDLVKHSFDLEDDVAGTIVLHAHVAGDETWAVGATTTNIRRK